MFFRALVSLAVVLTTSCGPSLYSAKRMSRAELSKVDDGMVCAAYASATADKSVTPALRDEVRARGLDCSGAMERYVSDCRQLRILSTQRHPKIGNMMVYEVENRSAKAKKFRIDHAGVSSPQFILRPGQSGGFGVTTNATVSAIAGATSKGGAPELYDCVTAG